MKYGKIIGILLVIGIAMTFVGVVSAEQIDIEGVKFNIPDGYKENTGEAATVTDSTGNTYVRCFDGDDGSFSINVMTDSSGSISDVQPQPGEVEKTINGIDGYYNNDTHDFQFVMDGKLICISGADEALLGEILVNSTAK